MIIEGNEIPAGTSKTINVNIARLPSHSPIDLSITVARAEKPGPTLLLSGGLHGDEINGIEIVRRIVDEGLNIPEAGTIICIPIINIYGFIHFSRYVPDGKDVNRSFPGNKSGSLASRVAYFLMKEIIPKIDLGIDFHTGGADRTNFPQVRGVLRDEEVRKLASVFQAPFTINSSYRPKSLRHAASRKGKKILVYEGGESGRFDEFAIQTGIDGALRVIQSLGMRKSAPACHAQPVVINRSTWIRAKASGLFQTNVESGDHVTKNQLLGHLTDPFGEFKVTVKSPANGYVIGLNNNPILHQGDAVMHLGFE